MNDTLMRTVWVLGLTAAIIVGVVGLAIFGRVVA